jgi:acetyl esterase/lipase
MALLTLALAALCGAGVIGADVHETPAASATYRHTDVRYGPESVEVADLYRLSGTIGRLPAILVVHGGGWHSGSKEGWRGRIGAFGSSAGGNLAAMLASDAYGPLDCRNRVAAAVTWSAMLDLTTQPGLADAMADYVGCRVNCSAVLAAASPLHHVSSDDTPIELFNSTRELVPMTSVRAMDARLTSHHVFHKLIIYTGSEHGVSYGDRAMASTVKFFHDHLG